LSKIALAGAVSGTATFTIESPATSTNRTITIPDATTTLVGTDATQTLTNKDIVATQLTGDVAAARITTALNASGSAPIFAARAWVNFDGTGTVAIRASGNVSSITDNGTGDYTVNFTTALPDANYAVNLTSRITSTGIPPVVVNLLTTTAPTSSLFRICTDRSGVGPVDPEFVFASVFR
jgi:hypothetical protein